MQTGTDQAKVRTRFSGRRVAEAGAILAVSVSVAVALPFLFIRLVARAQNSCFDVDAGQGFYLMVTWLELVIVGWVLFLVGAVIAWRMRLRPRLVARILTGVALVVALCLVATWQLVPWGPSADYPSTAVGECGAGGVPTWWPPFLPHH